MGEIKNSFEIEIAIHSLENQLYPVELRFSQPGGGLQLHSGTAQFDFDRLRGLELDLKGYGKALFESLFGDGKLRSWFDQAIANAGGQDSPVRIRLVIPQKSGTAPAVLGAAA